jgi:Uma2 family endonuclease
VEVSSDVEAQAMAMPSTDPAAAADGFAELERLWNELDVPKGVRAELIDGELVVSPTGSVWHSAAVDELMDQLFELKRRNGWRFHTYLTAHIPPTRERLIPDLMVAPKDAPPSGECELFSYGALLVAEVVSPWSRRRDRELKPLAYARGGVPLYVLVDRLDKPPAVTLFSQPGADGYGKRQVAAAGQPLRLPKPFGIALDTGRLLG